LRGRLGTGTEGVVGSHLQVRHSTRKACDARYTGTGQLTEVEGRWGDYSDITVDPSDDCTFWYTQEYLATGTVVIGTWRTRVVSFKFPGCKK
jgi:hypothetical protein